MSRLIDADKLPKYTGYALSASEVAKAVENAPTVDAVPVVRCGECKHREEKTFWCEKVQDFISNPEWFCADGERKGGDE